MATNNRKVGTAKNNTNQTLIQLQDIDEKLNAQKNKKPVRGIETGEWYTSDEIHEMRGGAKSSNEKWINLCAKAGLLKVGRKKILRVDGIPMSVCAYSFPEK